MINERKKKLAFYLNRRLNRLGLIFLLLIPVIALLWWQGVWTFALVPTIVLGAIILILSVFPLIFVHVSYDEYHITVANLMIIEMLCVLIAMNPYIELSGLYLFVPMLSLAYCDTKVTGRVSFLCFFGMLVAYSFREELMTETFIYSGTISLLATSIYINVIRIALEYVIGIMILYYVVGILEDRVLGETHTAMASSVMLDHSSLSDRDPYVQTTYDVEALFTQVDQELQAMIKGKNKTFTLEIADNLPVSLYGAKDGIQKAMISVVADLFARSDEGEITMEVGYHSGILPRKKQNITLAVTIKGTGSVASVTAQRASLSSYLGRSIIEFLRGSFDDHSDLSQVVYKIAFLQRVEDDTTVVGRREKQQMSIVKSRNNDPRANGRMYYNNKVNALVVDDEKAGCKLVDAILTSMGINVTTVDNGNDAISMLRDKEYQILFIDEMMPQKSGLETMRELRLTGGYDHQTLPIILMTVNVTDRAKEEYEESGFTGVVSKPIKTTEMEVGLRNWLKGEYGLTYAEYVKWQESQQEAAQV